MKPFRALLVLLALAILGALAWHQLSEDPGYLLLTFRGWSVETTLVVAVLALLLGAASAQALFGLVRAPLRLWRDRRQRVARQRLGDGLLALQEGRWLHAEKLLRRAAGDPSLRLPALLYASQAASERGAQEQADVLLGQAAGASGGITAALPGIERMLDDGRAATACELFDGLARQGELPPRALELRAQALAGCGRADEAVALLPELRRQRNQDSSAMLALETGLLRAWLEDAEHGHELLRRWHALTRAQRLQPALVEVFAERAGRVGEADAAAKAIERALDKAQWSDQLAQRYGSLPHADHGAALRLAEQWLEQHPNNAGVLLCLGQLCRQDQLWGKAEAYLGRAIAAGAGHAAWEALAETYADQGDDTRARQAYANALLATRGEHVQPVLRLQRTEEFAVAEERSSMGLPRLPA